MADKKGAFTTTKSCTFSVYTTLNRGILSPTKTAALEPSPKAQPKMLVRLELGADANIKLHLNFPSLSHYTAMPPGALSEKKLV